MARLLERDVAEILRQRAALDFPGTLWSVTKVRVTPDVGMARIYLSVFPTDRTADSMAYIEENKSAIRNQVGQLVRHQMRVVPELHYYADDSLDYEATIDRLLREGGENPIL
jgi:ribosome-binding factor A